ncbi:MAG: hypothetical protein CMP73_02030 [Flavobacteriales bacterium]|nr:hypothetical protein [Flavobacteriales bacterium]
MRYIFLLIFISIFRLHSQTITNYTVNDGLLDNFVECITVDINDNIWIGTSIGIQMFDGVNWTIYNTSTHPEIASDNVSVIQAMSNGDVWIGTDEGVSVFDGINWVTYNSANTNGVLNNQVKSIDEVNDGIWVGTISGVSYLIDPANPSWSSITPPDLHWSGVNSTYFDGNTTWFASPLGGVTHYENSIFTVYDTSSGLLSQNVTDLLIDPSGKKWIGTGGGISVLNSDNTNFTQHTKMYLLSPPDTLNPVVDLEIDSYGRIWAGIYVGYLAQGGVAYWNGIQWNDYDVTDGLVGTNIRDLAIDSQDNIWIATSTGISMISQIAYNLLDYQTIELIYPNPSDGDINISTNQEYTDLSVYNNLSQCVFSATDTYTHKFKLDLKFLPRGIYHIVLTNNTTSTNYNLLIK